MKTFEIATKKSKRRLSFKLGMITVIVIGLFITLSPVALNYLSTRRYSQVLDKLVPVEHISMPNIRTISTEVLSLGFGKFQIVEHRAKDIAGLKVPYTEKKVVYSLFNDTVIDTYDVIDQLPVTDVTSTTYYNMTNFQRNPVFFNTNYNYGEEDEIKPSQEISLLSQMPNQAVEVAITFDRLYTDEEIKNLLPEGLKRNFYWIGTTTDQETSYWSPQMLYGLSPWGNINDSFETVKTELTTPSYVYDSFKKVGENFLKTRHGLFQTAAKDLEIFLKKYPTAKEAKFAGVILTGRAETFASLEGADWIFASNIGESIPLQPYHRLDIE